MNLSVSRLVYIYSSVCSSVYLIIYLSNTYLSSIYSTAGSVPDPELTQKEAIRGLVLVEETSLWTYGLLILSWADPNTLLKSMKGYVLCDLQNFPCR